MVGDQHADPARFQVLDEVADIADRERVDPGEGLVQQHDRWFGRQRAGDFAAAPLTAGQRHGRAGAQPRQAEFVEQAFEFGSARIGIRLDHFEHAVDVLLNRHAAKNAGFLRQVTEAQDRAAVHRQVGDVLPIHHDAPGIGAHEAHDRIEAGRLASPVRTEQAEHLALADAQRNIGQDGALVVALGDGNDFEASLRDRRGGVVNRVGNGGGIDIGHVARHTQTDRR